MVSKEFLKGGNIMKGKNFLKVTGILMIIGGSIGLIAGVLAIISVGTVASLLETSAGVLMFASVLILVSAIIQLIAGISGIRYCAKPEKSNACIIMGALVAGLSLVGTLMSVSLGNDFNIMSMIIGLVLPVLYIIGAVLNKKELQ